MDEQRVEATRVDIWIIKRASRWLMPAMIKSLGICVAIWRTLLEWTCWRCWDSTLVESNRCLLTRSLSVLSRRLLAARKNVRKWFDAASIPGPPLPISSIQIMSRFHAGTSGSLNRSISSWPKKLSTYLIKDAKFDRPQHLSKDAIFYDQPNPSCQCLLQLATHLLNWPTASPWNQTAWHK